MKNEHLIKGHFTVDEAKEILQALFNSKIQFHTLAAFSIEERTGVRAQDHLNRSKELSNSIKDIVRFIQENENTEFEISCRVEIDKVVK